MFGLNLSKCLLCLTALLLIMALSAFSDESARPSGHILFVRVAVQADTVVVEKLTVVPGKVKSSRAEVERTGLYYELLDTEKNLLFADATENPLVRNFEFEDPDNPGKILSRQITLNEVVITLRLPDYPGAHSILFFLSDNTARGPAERLVGEYFIETESSR